MEGGGIVIFSILGWLAGSENPGGRPGGAPNFGGCRGADMEFGGMAS